MNQLLYRFFTRKSGIIATLVGEYKAPDGSICYIFDNQEGGVNLFITDASGELIAIVSETTIIENEDGSGEIMKFFLIFLNCPKS